MTPPSTAPSAVAAPASVSASAVAASDVPPAARPHSPEPVMTSERKAGWENVVLAIFIAVPFLALIAAVPVAWGWGLGWRDVAIAVLMYVISGHGITVGFHRYFTHGSFRANRGLK